MRTLDGYFQLGCAGPTQAPDPPTYPISVPYGANLVKVEPKEVRRNVNVNIRDAGGQGSALAFRWQRACRKALGI